MVTHNSDHNKIFAALKVEPIEELGGGTNGRAYLLSDGRVFKITESEAEFAQSTELIGKTIPRLARIYETYCIRKAGYNYYYVIIQERVDTTRRSELLEFENRTNFYDRVRNYVKSKDKEYITDEAKQVLEDYPRYKDLVDEYIAVGDAQIEGGFISSDMFEGNLGFIDDKLTVFDFGYSRKSIQVIEDNVVREID